MIGLEINTKLSVQNKHGEGAGGAVVHSDCGMQQKIRSKDFGIKSSGYDQGNETQQLSQISEQLRLGWNRRTLFCLISFKKRVGTPPASECKIWIASEYMKSSVESIGRIWKIGL